jgi:molybdate transport system permease protein
MTFAHTMGEFGLVLMIGGSIPGVTRVASVQIFDHVESLNSARAHGLAIVLLGFAVATSLLLRVLARRKAQE